MLSVLMTSTMKSEPLRASVSGVPSGRTFSFGGTGGTLETRAGAPCALALVAAARLTAGPAASAPARNWRRFILGCLDMAFHPSRFAEFATRLAQIQAQRNQKP